MEQFFMVSRVQTIEHQLDSIGERGGGSVGYETHVPISFPQRR